MEENDEPVVACIVYDFDSSGDHGHWEEGTQVIAHHYVLDLNVDDPAGRQP